MQRISHTIGRLHNQKAKLGGKERKRKRNGKEWKWEQDRKKLISIRIRNRKEDRKKVLKKFDGLYFFSFYTKNYNSITQYL